MFPTQKSALVIAVLLALAGCSRDPEVAKRRYLESGNKYFAKGKYKEARIFYLDATRKDKKFGAAYYKLGLTGLELFKLGQGPVSEVVRSFRRAYDLLPASSPDKWDSAVKISELYLELGSQQKELLDEVDGYIKALFQRDPNSFDGHRLNGDLNFRRFSQSVGSARRIEAEGYLNTAFDEYTKAAGIKPNNSGVLMQLAQVHTARNNLGEAERLLRQIVAHDKTFTAAYTHLYRLMLYEKKLPEGEQVLKDAIAANPKSYQFLSNLALHYAAAGNKEQMLATLQRIKSHAGEYKDAYLVVGDFYLRLGDAEAAKKEYREGIEKDPAQKLKYQKHIVEALMHQGKRTEAAALNAQILKDHPADTDAKQLAATFLLDSGDIQSAITELEAVVSRDQDNAIAHFQLGRAHAAKGEFEQAKQSFMKAIALHPELLQPRLALAQLQILRGEYDAALKSTEQILAVDPNNMNARLLASSALMGQRKFDDSRALLTAMAKTNPSSPDVYFQTGVVNLAENKYTAAEAAFRKSYELNPANNRGLLGLAETYMAQNKPDVAMKIVQDEFEKTGSKRLDLLISLGKIAARAGQYDRALGYYQKVDATAEKDARGRPDLYLQMAEVYRRKGDDVNAITYLQKSHDLQPKNQLTLVSLALLLDQNGRWNESRNAYEDVLKVDSNNGMALNNLAFLLCEHGGDLEDALQKANRAKALLPNLAEVSDTQGCIYMKKGLTDTAIGLFSELVKKVPKNATYRYHLAQSLDQKGDRSKAIKECQEALKLNPAKTDRDKIQALLNRMGGAM